MVATQLYARRVRGRKGAQGFRYLVPFDNYAFNTPLGRRTFNACSD
jgi:hypothetical protein